MARVVARAARGALVQLLVREPVAAPMPVAVVVRGAMVMVVAGVVAVMVVQLVRLATTRRAIDEFDEGADRPMDRPSEPPAAAPPPTRRRRRGWRRGHRPRRVTAKCGRRRRGSAAAKCERSACPRSDREHYGARGGVAPLWCQTTGQIGLEVFTARAPVKTRRPMQVVALRRARCCVHHAVRRGAMRRLDARIRAHESATSVPEWGVARPRWRASGTRAHGRVDQSLDAGKGEAGRGCPARACIPRLGDCRILVLLPCHLLLQTARLRRHARLGCTYACTGCWGTRLRSQRPAIRERLWRSTGRISLEV